MENKFFDSSVFVLTPEQWRALAPYLWLTLGIAVSTVTAALKARRSLAKAIMLIFLAPYSFYLMTQLGQTSQSVFGTSLEIDAITRIVGGAVGVFALVTSLFSSAVDKLEEHPEWSALLLTSVLGLSLLPGARDLVAFFVYLETLAISGYIMTSLDTSRERSLEAGIKYLLLGAFASALYLMGATLFYGLSGSFDYARIADHINHLAGLERGFALAGGVLILSSLMFKVSVVPFHMWAPDVYQAAPSSVAAFLATATKLSIFASSAVMLNKAGILNLPEVKNYLYFLGVITVLVGSVLAVAQTQIRRLFAYSGIVNAGYAALALCAGAKATGSLITSLLIYGGTLICLFAVIEVFARRLGKGVHADIEISELGQASSKGGVLVSGLFTFAVFSVAGIPPLPGFFGKYLVLKDLWTLGLENGTYVMLMGTLLGLAYYLRLLVPIYMEPVKEAARSYGQKIPAHLAVVAAVAAALISVIALGGLNRLPQWVHTVEGFAR